MEFTVDAQAAGLIEFIDASPSPYHAVDAVRSRLTAAGFVEVAETQEWPGAPGRYLVVREGSIAAWSTEHLAAEGRGRAATPFRVIGGHTDSPNLRVKPRPDLSRHGWDQLALEVYGGPLLNSWLDRDLGLSGRVMVRDATAPYGVRQVLWRTDEPICRIPQLAIHLDREVGAEGLKLNPQTQLTPVWGATGSAPSFADYLGGELERLHEIPAGDVLSWDIMTHDLTGSRRIGRVGDLIAAPRLDNLATSYAGTAALIAAVEALAAGAGAPAQGGAGAFVPVLVLFDHEEIGSVTHRGGDSQFLPALLERIVLSGGGGREEALRALAGTVICSADMAHAVHPNYAERHDPEHLLLVGQGPAVKVNSRGRYASDATGIGVIRLAAEQAGVELQSFVSRGDMPCGSTIGPMSAALTGAVTVDVGAPMLSMHSARELMGAADVAAYVALVAAFVAPR